MTQPSLISTAALLLMAALPALGSAQDEKPKDPAAGHSIHGEVFNEGPRQAAVLIPGCGEIDFKVTTKSPEAQQFFSQGVGQLHGFWDFEAERSFRQAAALDPDCAMAYWGMAMANYGNAKRGKGFAEEAKKRRDKVGEKEKMWIDGLVAYFDESKGDRKKRLREHVRSIEKIALKYPDDVEAKAFIMKQIYYNHSKGHPIPSHYAINQMAEAVFRVQSNHPTHHYRIHLWDREDPKQALASAAAGGPAAPAIAHMWHMPGHIYSRLHRYADAAWQQEASARIDHQHMIRFQLIPDQIGNFAHNNEWLIRNLNHLGRVRDAVDLAQNMTELPRRAKFSGETFNPSGSSWYYGRLRLRDTLFRFERWITLIALAEQTDYLKPDPKVIPEREWNRFLAIAKFEVGDDEGGIRHREAIETMLSEEKAKRDKAVADAEKKAKDAKKKEKDIENAKKAAEKTFAKQITNLENPLNEVRVYEALNADEPDLAKAKELLPKLKNIAKARHARLYHRVGDTGKAIAMAAEAVASGTNEIHPLAVQVEILHAAGKKGEAKAAFGKLRTVAAHADADLPLFSRIDPIVEEFGFPDNWRKAPVVAEDLGDRPDINTLGPFRWHPPKSPDFTLPDAKGALTTLSTFRKKGSPVLVIFYLGKGCAHCMDQLNDFAPLTRKYAAAGIPIVAVSTDSPAGLAETFSDFSEAATDADAAAETKSEADAGSEGETEPEKPKAKNPFPFPLLSDEKLDTFKAFRAYDDFENMALHGTFLIDARGQIRWQDISYEPFMKAEWLLEECQRLLSFEDS